MYLNDLDNLEEREMVPGFFGRFIHTDKVTIGYFNIKGGSVLPEHAHFHEQISNVISGRFQLTINGETNIYDAGKVAVIPSDVPHSGKALNDCFIIDVFCPVREDYK